MAPRHALADNLALLIGVTHPEVSMYGSHAASKLPQEIDLG